jgi:CubicO group peptidase (beta-lactamase class C family)
MQRTIFAAALLALAMVSCSDGGDSGAGPNAGAGAGTGAVGGSAANGGASGTPDTSGTGGAAGTMNVGGMTGGMSSAGTGGSPDDPDAAAPDAGDDDIPDTVDPGTAEWEPVPAADVETVCKLDPALLAEADAALNIPYVIVRYGKLCHEHYPDGETPMTTAEVFSTTKSFGALVVGIASWQTRDIPRTGPKTGQLSDWDRADHWLDAASITYNKDAHVAHVLGMVAHNEDLSYGMKQHQYDTVGDIQINTLSDMVNAAVAQDTERLGANIEEFTQRHVYAPLGMTLSSWTADATDKNFAYTWSSSVREMARVGLLILNRGVWSGQRLVDQEYIYKMTHPSFEDGNTAYGYLTWLATWSNHSIGFSPPTDQGPNILGYDGNPCAPVALWNNYPHGEIQEAPDCNYEAPYDCEQTHDVGVWQAVGLGGQLIQGHPGLDLVIAARNDAAGGAGLWSALIPAVAKADPMFAGDTAAFCEAYSANEYAPDLKTPWPDYD